MPASLLTLLDDITMMADDVALMTKVATKKTAGVLGDDIALNANSVTGVSPSRELPVVWAVAKGSALNKSILVPLALALIAFAPWALTPLLMVGGAFLCYEGVEKLFHKFFHNKEEDTNHYIDLKQHVQGTPEQVVEAERQTVKGAIRTDAILSGEIIAISLGTMQGAALSQQAVSLIVISIIMTVGVYGLVAGIVKLDDAGIYLAASENKAKQAFGRFILRAAPYLMRMLSILGTAAMFLVGGGIITHGIHAAHDIIEGLAHNAGSVPFVGGFLSGLTPHLADMVVGVIVGIFVLAFVKIITKMFKKTTSHAM
jgi:predicted DNA repair protein MutK